MILLQTLALYTGLSVPQNPQKVRSHPFGEGETFLRCRLGCAVGAGAGGGRRAVGDYGAPGGSGSARPPPKVISQHLTALSRSSENQQIWELL